MIDPGCLLGYAGGPARTGHSTSRRAGSWWAVTSRRFSPGIRADSFLDSFERTHPPATTDWPLALDTPEAWDVIRAVLDRLAPVSELFGPEDVERLVARDPAPRRRTSASDTSRTDGGNG
jgi:hypothetical protein